MTDRELLNTIGDVDDRFIAEAAPTGRKRNIWIRFVAAACLIFVVGLLALPMLQGTTFNGRYKYNITQREAAALVLRWEDRTLGERFLEMSLDRVQYGNRGQTIDASMLGGELGICDAWGFDHYTEQTYHQDFAVYAIEGIQEEKLVAVCMEGTYYVFLQDGYNPPETLGELLAVYNLAENLPLTRFSLDEQYYLLENDDVIWQILAECGDAPVVEDDDFLVSGKHISFTATSEALGIYKRVFYVTKDGYVKTNALDYGYVYFIGAEAAGRIMEYALANATETEPEPYTNFVAGTITEIGDGYILVDDAVLCWREADGKEFRILTDNPEFSRWLKYHNFRVGDVVYIQYRGEIGAENVIAGAYSISEAILSNGDVLVAG